jgi:hypothetical protein
MPVAVDWRYGASLRVQEAVGEKSEANRRLLVRLVFLIYWLLIFEGALRKWGLPQLQDVFFFLRIPVTLLLYWVAFKYRCWPHTAWPLLLAYIFSAVAIVLVPFQIIAGGYGPPYLLLAGYGWINYFFYVPLAFLIAEQFRKEDLDLLTRHTLWLTIPAALLVIMQFSAPTTAVINLGSGLKESDQFQNLGAALGFVRPTGFFTSSAGQSQFIASAAALVLVGWLVPKRERPVGLVLLIAGTAAVLVLTAFSQSRGLFFQLGIVLLLGIAAGLLTGRRRIIVRVVLWPPVLLGAAIALWPLLFPKAYEVFLSRWIGAWGDETQIFQYGIFGRMFHSFYAFLDYLPSTPLIGYLLGFGGNASLRLDWVRLPSAAYDWTGYGIWGLEGGWAVHLIELGLLAGLAFIVFRIGLILWAGWNACKCTHYSGHPLPVLLFGYAGIILLNGQITTQGTINGYGWMFLGFCLSAIRTFGRSSGQVACRPVPRQSSVEEI